MSLIEIRCNFRFYDLGIKCRTSSFGVLNTRLRDQDVGISVIFEL